MDADTRVGAGQHMAAEIAEQPAAVARTLTHLAGARDDLAALLQGARRVSFSARGSSDNAAIYGRYLMEARCGFASGHVAPSIATHYGADVDLDGTVVVSISQSGRTEEIVAGQEWARRNGARTVAITNHEDSPLATGADVALVTQAGQEQAVPATKTYTTQLAAVAVLGSVASTVRAGRTGNGRNDAWAADLARIPEAMQELLDRSEAVGPLVAAWQDRPDLVITSRGLCLGTALETALKVEETCLRSVRSYSYADLRHGPIAAVDDSESITLVAPADGPMVAPLADLAGQVAERGATVVGIGGDAAFAAAVGHHVPGPDLPEHLAPLGLVLPGQLACLELSRSMGLDPDTPGGLRKVTRTDRS
ncbi:SIS domain-containing protein [Kytococcus sedentarius]|uniref:SIS domain-containing protein n=1 Tax=Kytococcus sedentarius TaxID=1276 RepID=UPI0035BC0906